MVAPTGYMSSREVRTTNGRPYRLRAIRIAGYVSSLSQLASQAAQVCLVAQRGDILLRKNVKLGTEVLRGAAKQTSKTEGAIATEGIQ